MIMSTSRRLPSGEDVWARIRTFAIQCKDDGRRLYTLQRFVPNIITSVSDSRIERYSAEGRTHTAHIDFGHVARVWNELRERGWSSTRGNSRVFTHALMLHALPTWIELAGPGTIRLRGGAKQSHVVLPSFAAEETIYDPRPRRSARSGGGEGPIHRAIRLYIFEEPDRALVDLPGGPWVVCRTEHTLETQDRIDVVLRDDSGNYVLLEVKPELVSDQQYSEIADEALRAYAKAPFAQAAKYRSQWNILYGTPLERIRPVVAAPAIPAKTLVKQMRRMHDIESVAVALPPSRQPE